MTIDSWQALPDDTRKSYVWRGTIDRLLMRGELSDSVKESAVRSFPNIPSFSLLTSNVSSLKVYAKTYSKFQEAFISPDWYVKTMYDSGFFNHFYEETLSSDLLRSGHQSSTEWYISESISAWNSLQVNRTTS